MQQLNTVLSKLPTAGSPPLALTGVSLSAAALCIAQTLQRQPAPALCITASEARAETLCQDLALFSPLPVLHYQAHEIPPYTPLSPDPKTVSSRLNTLYQLRTTGQSWIMVASVESLLRRTMPSSTLTGLAELLIKGEEVLLDQLTLFLDQAGYEHLSLVQNPGEYSIRGGIVDIFVSGADYPVRLDLFGDFIESIRFFDPISQRSVEDVEEVEVIPASEILFPRDETEQRKVEERLRTLADTYQWHPEEQEVLREKITQGVKFPGIEFFLPLLYDQLADPLAFLPKECCCFITDPLEVKRSISLVWERIEANYNEAREVQTIALPPSTLFLDEAELAERLRPMATVIFKEFKTVEAGSPELLDGQEHEVSTPATSPSSWPFNGGVGPDIATTNHTLLRQNLDLQRRKQTLLSGLAQVCVQWLDQGDHIHLACRSLRHAENLHRLLAGHGLDPLLVKQPLAELHPVDCKLTLYPMPLSAGFDLPDEKLHILSETELFGEKRVSGRKTKKTKAPKSQAVNFEELHIGDLVVHSEHGIATYDGIINIELNSIANDFLRLLYKDDDKLYVPVDRINTVSKYSGLSDRKPPLSRLGSKMWEKTKKKVKDAVWQVAQNLLHLYARRKLEKGHAFTAPQELYHELEESFPFEETAGQQKAINEVLDDLTSERPMDRLICGDVGFGKTEVAVRAAFKVAEDGSQVAVLVPTTVLAEQHAQTFRERFEGFPLSIECLNRFRSSADQKKIIKKLGSGQIDIIIGTHRLLSKDVLFQRLGLLIIDEEHRFGVTHKEKLKMLRHKVDVLTLTATPIPRTMQMSLLGVRDLSVISSPPRHRRSVKTFIAKYDDLVIKEAIVRELQRGGQVFLVHNRVHSIHQLSSRVQKLVPEARLAVAHGQMPGKSLEEIMVKFVTKEVNVLICTTIIESGLDIPNANTIIINRADRLGLAEIYQLRGRVGRSAEQAYAYLLVPSLEHLSKDAKQRLRALMDYNELGGGFKLAMSDLQIRGGGNILGESQSGNIAAVGYDLYLDLLQRTVEDLKHRAESGETEEQVEIEPEINLALSAYIPESYIPDPDQRYLAYRRVTGVGQTAELQDLKEEFRDRYGVLPQETENLFLIIAMKEQLSRLRITKLEQSPKGLVFSFHNTTPVTPEQTLLFIKMSKGKARLTPDSRLMVFADCHSAEQVFEAVKNTLQAIT